MEILEIISRLTKHCLVHLLNSLVVSRLEFASVIWNFICNSVFERSACAKKTRSNFFKIDELDGAYIMATNAY